MLREKHERKRREYEGTGRKTTEERSRKTMRNTGKYLRRQEFRQRNYRCPGKDEKESKELVCEVKQRGQNKEEQKNGD
jgi:hypothetical protein